MATLIHNNPMLALFKMVQNVFKTQTPLEKLNQERMALGYDPLTQSEWLAVVNNNRNLDKHVVDEDVFHDHDICVDVLSLDLETDFHNDSTTGDIFPDPWI